MAHVYGHTDFFNRNFRFAESNRNMLHVMGNNRRFVEALKLDRRLEDKIVNGMHPVTDFIEKYHALEWLVDFSQLAPPPLTYWWEDEFINGLPEMVSYDDLGPDAKAYGISDWWAQTLIPKEKLREHIDKLKEEDETFRKRIPHHPTRDVLGF